MSPGRLRASLVVVAIVVGSLLVGAAVDHAMMSRRGQRNRPGLAGAFTREAASQRRAEMLGRLTSELGLESGQRAAIDSIMARTDSAVRAVNAEMKPRLQQLFDSSRAAIGARLDSAQRVKFNARRPARHWRAGDGPRPPA